MHSFRVALDQILGYRARISFRPSKGEVYVIAAKITTIMTGGISLLLATYFLSPVYLGYYYSFLSIALWRTAADGGMSYLIVRFTAHEWAHIHDSNPEVQYRAKGRLASLIKLTLIAYFGFAALFGIGTYILGLHWFGKGVLPDSKWQMPLLMLAIAMALNMIALPFRALLEGVNDIVTSNRGSLLSNLFGAGGCWILLWHGEAFYAVPVWFSLSAVISCAIWLPKLIPIWSAVRHAPQGERISWLDELWPLQWRLFLSIAGGMLMFQLYVPVAFIVLGPVAAGRIGVVLQIQQAIDQLGGVWLQARLPSMAMMAARGRFAELRDLAGRTIQLAMITTVFFASLIIGAYLIAKTYFPIYGQRLPGIWTFLLFVLTGIFFQPEHVQAAVIRCQKREPFVVLSIGTGLLTLGLTYFLSKLWGEIGIGLSFFACICCVLVPVTISLAWRITPHQNLEPVAASWAEDRRG